MSENIEVKTPNEINEVKEKKEKKPNAFVRWLGKVGNYLKDCFRERKKIIWYGKKQTAVATLLVTICLVILAVIIGGLDYAINQLIDLANRIY